MKKCLLTLIIFSFVSCKKDTGEITKYDKNGNISTKEYFNKAKFLDSIVYFKNGQIDKKSFYKKNSKTECYIKYYDAKGKVELEGKIEAKNRIGNWKQYWSDGLSIIEYKIVNKEQYPNQVRTYKYGKLDNDLSSFYSFKFNSDTSIKGSKIKILKVYYKPHKKGAICTINLSQKINKDYSNIDSIEKFTLKPNSKFVFTIPILAETLKQKTIMGYIDEHHFDENSKNLDHTWKRMYVSIPVKE